MSCAHAFWQQQTEHGPSVQLKMSCTLGPFQVFFSQKARVQPVLSCTLAFSHQNASNGSRAQLVLSCALEGTTRFELCPWSVWRSLERNSEGTTQNELCPRFLAARDGNGPRVQLNMLQVVRTLGPFGVFCSQKAWEG